MSSLPRSCIEFCIHNFALYKNEKEKVSTVGGSDSVMTLRTLKACLWPWGGVTCAVCDVLSPTYESVMGRRHVEMTSFKNNGTDTSADKQDFNRLFTTS